MKWFIGLAIIFVLFAGTSLSLRISAPGRHFHRRSLATNQGFLQAHKKFTQTLSHVAATIQEAREGLSETKQTEIHEERSDHHHHHHPHEEVETSVQKYEPEVVKDAEKEGTCLHPKDVNCKPNEDVSDSNMADDQREIMERNLDIKPQESDEEKPDITVKVEIENDTKIENSTEVDTESSTEILIGLSTEMEGGNSTEIETGNGTEIETGNGTEVDNGNGTEDDNGNGTEVDNGNGTESEIANTTLIETENHTETFVDQEKVPSETVHENVAPSEDRSDELVRNQIIVDEEEFQNEAIKPQLSDSTFFAKFFKLIKDNSQVILGL